VLERGDVQRPRIFEPISRDLVLDHDDGRCDPLGEAIARKLAARDPNGPLTPREFDVLRLLREGLSIDQMGRRLDITERTVRAHVTAIKVKLDAANTAQAVARGFERGLLSGGPPKRIP
jgi:DNA-binding NarL/FixJ family response regulator